MSNCPATGRSASVCADQSHVACWIGLHESMTLDAKVEAAHRATDPTY